MPWEAYLQGFGISFGLIVAIGAQNAFVLRQGLKRERVFTIALTASLCDALLIFIGVNGLGGFLSSSPALSSIARWGGALFLTYFSIKSFRAALNPKGLMVNGAGEIPASIKKAIATSLGFSLLNPHAILDTVVLIGSVGSQYPSSLRQVFMMGAGTASFVWFFGLAYGAAKLAPLFAKPSAWRVLDTFIGLTMAAIAVSLVLS